jgi:imidazole glycerol phosphate synthase subunit HisF
MWSAVAKRATKFRSIHRDKKIRWIMMLASKFGSQCVVVAIDAKQIDGQWIVHLMGGKVPTELNLFDWAVEVAERSRRNLVYLDGQ